MTPTRELFGCTHDSAQTVTRLSLTHQRHSADLHRHCNTDRVWTCGVVSYSHVFNAAFSLAKVPSHVDETMHVKTACQ